jgi:hypothetical protein
VNESTLNNWLIQNNNKLENMGNQGMGGPGGGRNPFGQMSEEEKKKARERRQEECKCYKYIPNPLVVIQLLNINTKVECYREEKTRGRTC